MVKGGRWEDNYNFTYLPNSIDPIEIRKKLKTQEQQSAQK